MKFLFFIYIALIHCFFVSSLLGSENQRENKVILITGASRGIGWETAKKLAQQGHAVYASMRSPTSFLDEGAVLPSSLHLLALNVTDEESIEKAFKILYDKEQRLDVLINNAGCAVFGPVEVVSIEQAKKVFDVNFFGTMRLMQKALPLMREQGGGLIINLSSTSGVRPSPGWDIYAASKFAIEGLSEAVAALALQWNIDIVLIEPGATSTDFMTQSTEIGNRRTPHTAIFDHFMPHAIKWMQERLKEGQPPQEVADVIASIIGSEDHLLRYQTSSKGRQLIANRHCDPTGKKSIQEQESLIRQLWQGPLDSQIGGSYR